MERIKVLHIITGGLHREGITSAQLEFFRHMDLSLFEINIAAVHKDEKNIIDEFVRIGCKVIEFPDRQQQTIKYFLALIKTIREMRVDIIHVHGSSAIMSIELLAAKIAGVRVRIAHSRNTKADQARIDKMLRPLFNHLYNYGLACGNDAGRWLFGNRPFTVLHNGKDLSRFHYDAGVRNEKRSEYALQNKIVVGHVGAFNDQKNHEYLVEVFAEFLKKKPNSVLYMLGNGHLQPLMQQKAKNLHIEDKMIFAGNVRDVPDRLQAMDIMVFPSRFEGLPNVVLEWQAEGLPCLISDKITNECAPSDLVEFASIDDPPKVWADKMEQMLAEFTDRKSQAARGTEALKQHGFDIEDAAKQLEDIYLNLVSRK